MKNWFKEHESTVVTLGAAFGLWIAITTSFHRDMDKFDLRLTAVENRIIDLDKRLTSVETVLLMQGHPLRAMAKQEDPSIPSH